MQKPQAHDSDPSASLDGASATPRVSGGPPAQARAEPVSLSPAPADLGASPEPGAVSEPSDTLLSAGKPADKLELLLEDRLALVDERLRELDERLAKLERKKPNASPEPRQKPWLWLAFLIALVVVFQLLQRVR